MITARFSNFFSRPLHGLGSGLLPDPSDESLGYYQSSANADSATLLFVPSFENQQSVGCCPQSLGFFAPCRTCSLPDSQPMAIILSTALAARARISSGISMTYWWFRKDASVSSRVIWFICGQRTLHRRSISFSGLAAAIFSPIEHSVRSR